MLRKRARSMQKEVDETARPDPGLVSSVESQVRGNSEKGNTFFDVARLFLGLNPENASYIDSAKSPKSPLDEIFLRSPRSPSPSQDCQKSWNSGKVGLSIVDSLHGGDGRDAFARERILLSSDSKNRVLGPKTCSESPDSDTDKSLLEPTLTLPENFEFRHSHTKSPQNKGSSDVVFEIGRAPPYSDDLFGKIKSCSMDACVMASREPQLTSGGPKLSNIHFPAVASKDGFVGSLSANDIELSEDYTCVTLHGPNPRTIHIYGDCILEGQSSGELLGNFVRKFEEDMQTGSKAPASDPCGNSLNSCNKCNKSLEDGKDIYMYRGEKAFCSVECRLKEILSDETTEESAIGSGDKGGILKEAP